MMREWSCEAPLDVAELELFEADDRHPSPGQGVHGGRAQAAETHHRHLVLRALEEEPAVFTTAPSPCGTRR